MFLNKCNDDDDEEEDDIEEEKKTGGKYEGCSDNPELSVKPRPHVGIVKK